MKKIINGKVYDTEKAELLATAHHENVKDYAGITLRQWLHRKRTGEFFLAVEGASQSLANVLPESAHSSGIYPLTREQAQSWAERELSADDWERIFGDPDDDAKTALSFLVPAPAAAKLAAEATKRGISKTELLLAMIGALDKT